MTLTTREGGISRRAVLGAALAAPMVLSGRAYAASAGRPMKLTTMTSAAGGNGVALIEWADKVSAETDGAFSVEDFFGNAMGPAPEHFNLARKGVADMCFHLTTLTPGQFPLTELVASPYMVPDGAKGSVVGTSILNSMTDQLESEYDGVKVIFTAVSRPSVIFDATKPITSLDDLKGRRYRVASSWLRDLFRDIGGVPVGMPTSEMAEALQKGVVDGVLTDDGAVFNFKVGNLVKYRTPAFFVPFTFVFGMNMRAYEALPDDVRAVVDANSGLEASQRFAITSWGDREDLAAYQAENPQEHHELDAESAATLRALSDKMVADKVAEYEGKGLPAAAVYEKMKELSAKFQAELD